MLQLKDIKKSYGSNVVLDRINLELTNGIYGFLGANGVGKTTLFKIISGYITNYKGKVIYPQIKEKKNVMLGFLPQNFIGYPDMTIYQFLLYLGKIKSNFTKSRIDSDIDEKLELFNLTDIRGKKLGSLSGGQLRRVGLAQAFQLNPQIVMLDEPTTGLDPTERIKFKNYISDVGHSQTVLISTHIVTDLEFISKKIFILKNCHFVMSGSEKSLIEKCAGLVWEAEFQNETELHRCIGESLISMIYDHGNRIKVRIISSMPPTLDAVKVEPNLNDVYLVNFKKEADINVI